MIYRTTSRSDVLALVAALDRGAKLGTCDECDLQADGAACPACGQPLEALDADEIRLDLADDGVREQAHQLFVSRFTNWPH